MAALCCRAKLCRVIAGVKRAAAMTLVVETATAAGAMSGLRVRSLSLPKLFSLP
jgi:hypothetical protein